MNPCRKLRLILTAMLIGISIIVQSLSPMASVHAAQSNTKPAATITEKILYTDYQNYTVQFTNLSKKAIVTYKSSRPEVATVSSKGLIKPVKVGKTTVTATIRQGGKTYASQIKVTIKEPYFEITDKIFEIELGSTFQFKYKAYGIRESSLTWSSSNSKVASIDKSSGVLTTKKAGQTGISLEESVTGRTWTVPVTVKAPYQPPEGSENAIYLSGLDLSKETGTYYTTKKEEYIETTRFILYLDKGVEVPVNVIELINYIMDLVETETGYKFYVKHRDDDKYRYLSGMNYELDTYFDNAEELKKIDPSHEKVGIVVAKHDQLVQACAKGLSGVLLYPQHIKLLDGKVDIIIHELLHIAWLRNGSNMGSVLCEGFTTYYTARIIEKDTKFGCTYDSYDELKNYINIIAEDTMEDLFIRYAAGSSRYQLGFRMTHFIMEEYGADAYRRLHKKVTEQISYQVEPPMEEIAAIIKAELSEDFFEAFARWYKANRERFRDKDMSSQDDWLIGYGYLQKYYGDDPNVIIPSTVVNIAGEAFMSCNTLESVVIPNSVVSIGGGAFMNCKKLKEMIVPDSITRIFPNAFEDCDSLEKVVLPKGIKKIEVRTFMDCPSLKEITLPEGLTSIDSCAFLGCSGLTKINLPDTMEDIGQSAFSGCSSIENIVLPDNIKSLPDDVFSDCTSLKSVILPKKIKEISQSLFWSCTSLEELSIPNGVTSIGIMAFNLSGISDINIPNTVTEIGEYAFANCKNLKKIIIPKSVTSIGNETFNGCTGLTIYGNKGSYAEKYAKQRNIKFSMIK